MNIKRIIKSILLEADLKPVTGDKAAQYIAKAGGHIENVKDRLAKRGIYGMPSLEDVFTLEQLSIEPFKFDFLLQVKDGPQDLTLPKPIEFTTLARVVNQNPFILEVKLTDDVNFIGEYSNGEEEVTISEGTLFKMMLDEKDLTTNLPGTKEAVKAIKIKNFYDIKGDVSLIKVLTPNKGEEGTPETTEFEVGQEITDAKGTVFIIRNIFKNDEGVETVQIQKKGNKGTAGLHGISLEKLHSWFNEQKQNEGIKTRGNLLLERSVEQSGSKNIIGKINVSDITLGPKAKAKKGEIRGGGSRGWDGMSNSLPKTGITTPIRLTLDDSGLNQEQEQVFNQLKGLLQKSIYEGTALLRVSNMDKNNIVVEFKTQGGVRAFVCKVPTGSNLRKPTNIEISPKMGGKDIFTKSTKAKIQVK